MFVFLNLDTLEMVEKLLFCLHVYNKNFLLEVRVSLLKFPKLNSFTTLGIPDCGVLHCMGQISQ